MESIEFIGQKVEIKRKAFQKRLGLSVYPNGRVRVSANKSLSQKEIIKFLESNRDWLAKSLESSSEYQLKYPPKKFQSGEVYPYMGGDYQLQISHGPRLELRFVGGKIELLAPIPEAEFTPEVRAKYFKSFKASYRKAAEQIMSGRIESVSYTHLTLPTTPYV